MTRNGWKGWRFLCPDHQAKMCKKESPIECKKCYREAKQDFQDGNVMVDESNNSHALKGDASKEGKNDNR